MTDHPLILAHRATDEARASLDLADQRIALSEYFRSAPESAVIIAWAALTSEMGGRQ